MLSRGGLKHKCKTLGGRRGRICACTGFKPTEALQAPVNRRRAKLGVLLPQWRNGLWKEWTLLKTTTRWPHSMRLWSWHVQFKVWDVKGGKSDTGGERNATPRCVYGFVIKSHFRHFTGPTCHGLGQCKTEAHTTFKVVNGKTLLGHKGTNGRWKPVCLARIRNL